MTHEERSLIQDLDKCDFGEIHAMHKAKTEARKNMSKEEKQVKLFLSLYLYAAVFIMCSVITGVIVQRSALFVSEVTWSVSEIFL